MRKIINGKKYDTKTAQMMASWDNGRYGDFAWCSEDLYRKRTGEYFIYGGGGPMSKYAEYYGNTTTGGDAITPLTEEEAREWAETHCSGEEYEEIFGEVEEDGDNDGIRFSLTLPVALNQALKSKALELKITKCELIREILEQKMK